MEETTKTDGLLKTPEQIEELKRNWLHDPCWDIEETEGFENYKEELLKFRMIQESEWEDRANKREAKEMEKMGITDKAVYKQIKRLDFLIERLEEKIEELEDR